MNPQQIEKFVYDKIPIARMLGVKVLKATEEVVEISAPLSLNHNHLGTAFGGSMNAVLVLAGYMWLYLALDIEGLDGDVILKKSRIEYMNPLNEDLRAICNQPLTRDFKKFMDSFRRKGVGRLELEAKIFKADGTEACQFNGEFVARAKGT